MQEVIITNNHYYSSFGEQISFQKIENALRIQGDWKWLGYLLVQLINKNMAVSYIETATYDTCLFFN